MTAFAEQGRLIDHEVSPEGLWGSPERQSYIVMRPEGLNLAFDVENLAISQSWARALEGLAANLGRTEEDVTMSYFPNGILREARIGGGRIGLARSIFGTWQRGAYRLEGVHDILTAIRLQRAAALALAPTKAVHPRQVGDPYIREDFYAGHWFHLENLGYPERFMQGSQLLNPREKELMIHEAGIIAGQFGLRLTKAEFTDESGVLGNIEVAERGRDAGNGHAIVWKDGGFEAGRYLSDPWQAAALLGIGAYAVNYLLDREQRSR